MPELRLRDAFGVQRKVLPHLREAEEQRLDEGFDAGERAAHPRFWKGFW